MYFVRVYSVPYVLVKFVLQVFCMYNTESTGKTLSGLCERQMKI